MTSGTDEHRSFGLLVGGILAAFGGWWLFRGKFQTAAPAFLAVGLLLVLLGAAAPRLLARPYRLWMALAEGLSFVMTRVVLLIVFALVVTPIGILRRLSGADPLRRRAGMDGGSWQPYPERHRDPRHYERMF
jgi:hypothetical protein